ncbi:MAG: NUDIX domain-containing protein [Candidatus Levybacteria bacterium]|nr:NUDIX domain-containing protein [Candidatus Levybacteria bacterium]MBP9815259.1 NUDIX domain-containing protein [Candidatus Levybacteria bacterium]
MEIYSRKETELYKITPIVYMILRDQESRILLLGRRRTGKYSIPAGHMEEGEESVAAALREVKEEVGVRVDTLNTRLVNIGNFKDPDGQRIGYFYETKIWTGKPKVMEPDIHSNILWAPIDSLPENLSPNVRQVLLNIEKGQFYTKNGWHTRS